MEQEGIYVENQPKGHDQCHYYSKCMWCEKKYKRGEKAVDAMYLILPPEVKAQVEVEIRDYEDFVPQEELDRIGTMRPVDAHFAARKIEMKYTRSETDRMFSLIVDYLSKAGLLLSSAPRGVGKVGKKSTKPKETEKEKK